MNKKKTIKGFFREVTNSKVKIKEFPNDVWLLDFKVNVSLETILDRLPSAYKCSTIGYFGGLLSLGICPKSV